MEKPQFDFSDYGEDETSHIKKFAELLIFLETKLQYDYTAEGCICNGDLRHSYEWKIENNYDSVPFWNFLIYHQIIGKCDCAYLFQLRDIELFYSEIAEQLKKELAFEEKRQIGFKLKMDDLVNILINKALDNPVNDDHIKLNLGYLWWWSRYKDGRDWFSAILNKVMIEGLKSRDDLVEQVMKDFFYNEIKPKLEEKLTTQIIHEPRLRPTIEELADLIKFLEDRLSGDGYHLEGCNRDLTLTKEWLSSNNKESLELWLCVVSVYCDCMIITELLPKFERGEYGFNPEEVEMALSVVEE